MNDLSRHTGRQAAAVVCQSWRLIKLRLPGKEWTHLVWGQLKIYSSTVEWKNKKGGGDCRGSLFVALSYILTQYAAKLNSHKYRFVRNMSSPAEFLQYSQKQPNILEASVIREGNAEWYAGMQDVTAALERDGCIAVRRQKKPSLVTKREQKTGASSWLVADRQSRR